MDLDLIPVRGWESWKNENRIEISTEPDSNGYHKVTWYHAKHQVPIKGVVIEFRDIECGEDIAIIEYEPTPPPQWTEDIEFEINDDSRNDIDSIQWGYNVIQRHSK